MNELWLSFLCLVWPWNCGEARDWDFVQSVGGIAVAAPVRQGGRVLLPVRADVSGTEQISVKPVMLNSGLVCMGVSVVRDGQEIGLTIRTGLLQRGRDARCPAADLGDLPPGTYRIVYLSPDGSKQPLGDFSL
ncbi:MAG: hypothetical protein ACAI44_14260 [Candidatus Sericytochromatia bacterium]